MEVSNSDFSSRIVERTRSEIRAIDVCRCRIIVCVGLFKSSVHIFMENTCFP